MPAQRHLSHSEWAGELRTRAEQAGVLDGGLRRGILNRVSGGPAVPEPYDTLARRIGEDSYRATDAQVEAVVRESGSDKAAFEVVLAAAVGAGLLRWHAAQRTLDGAGDAAS